MHRLSIRTLLLTTNITLLLSGFLGLLLVAGSQITSGVRADYEQRLQNEIRLIAQGAAASIAAYAQDTLDESGLDAVLLPYEQQIGGELAVYFTGFEPGSGENSQRRRIGFDDFPEISAAVDQQTLVVERDDTLFTAASVQVNNQPVGLLQLAVPASGLQITLAQRWLGLGAGFALLLLLTTILVVWLSSLLTRPLMLLRDSSSRLAGGDLSYRIAYDAPNEFGEVARAFNQMAAQVQAMIEEQRAFIGNTSHELRTPLTTIQLRAEALNRTTPPNPETARRYLSEIESEAAHLGRMVQSLTVLAHLDAGRLELGRDEIDITRFCSAFHQQMLPLAEEKSIRFTLLKPDEPLLTEVGIPHLTIVFRNLIENALKYTPDQGEIVWQVTAADRGSMHVVRDSGQGIAADDLPHLFERFYRADKSRSRHIPGSGLGLSLVRSIVNAYGGTVTITSDGVGCGTTVTVFWPSQRPADKAESLPEI